ncbi:GAF domain-containing protein [Nocardia inohanensis]|uniref:GAF domain-containing protein n=1 Tax=Nocardia inohanensis TaxID=209246 RepID=UPI000AB066F6|nr:GAF domain-containing protein [Nocardia inohanensis]
MTRKTLAQRRAVLEKEWADWVPRLAVAAAPESNPAVRTEVARSWTRSLPTVDPSRDSAPGTADSDARWARSPLRGPVLDLSDQLRSATEDAEYVAAVTDETGTILWAHGGTVMRRRAEQVNFAPGGRWDETHMGTNALSLALESGRPATVFSAEHLVAALHGWVCYCAPIRDAQGRTLGVLDLSSTWDRSHPLAMATVQSLVIAIEARLRSEAQPEPGVRLNCLGSGGLTRDGHRIRMRPRHLEILALLALEPDGLTPDQLHFAVYGDRPVTTSTLKADVSHLRRETGGEISNRTYRLISPLWCDAVELVTALRAGDTATAVRLYRGPLLPESETPGIIRWRQYLEVAVRTAVLSSTDPNDALAYGQRAVEDAEIHEHALRLLPAGDGRRSIAAARLHAALHG